MDNVVVSIFTGVVIATVSSWITVQLSLRKFRSERWWERKAEAYSKIIEALHNSKTFSSEHLDAEMKIIKMSEERGNDLRERSKIANDEILKAMDVGAFLLSDEANTRLNQFHNESQKASNCQSWFEYLETDYAATNNCLKDFIDIAKRDLKMSV